MKTCSRCSGSRMIQHRGCGSMGTSGRSIGRAGILVSKVEPLPACPVCGASCRLLDSVDFNKSCEEQRGVFLPRANVTVRYLLCSGCGFCFAPDICAWPPEEFERRIYN